MQPLIADKFAENYLIPDKGILPESIDLPSFEHKYNEVMQLNTGQMLRFIVYALSNNLESYFETLMDPNMMGMMKGRLLVVLKSKSFPGLLSSGPISHLPSSKTLIESMFRLSVEAEDLATVQHLLENGVNPDRHRCHHSKLKPGLYPTPLQFALLSGNLAIAKLLIHYGATLNYPGTGWRSSSIALTLIGWHQKPESEIKDLEDSQSPANGENAETITSFIMSLVSKGASIDMEELNLKPSYWDRDYSNWLPQPSHGW
jgi:hypothetical protein